MKSLGEIKIQIEKLISQIEIPSELLPSFGTFPGHYTYRYLENNEYHWVEGGNSSRISGRATTEFGELNYMVFETLTRQKGLIHEFVQRNPALDNRRLSYQHQLAFLEKLDATSTKKHQKEIEEELKWYPKDHK
jgi:hypothetical protein